MKRPQIQATKRTTMRSSDFDEMVDKADARLPETLPLPAKYEMFCIHFVRTLEVNKAAELAGFNPKSGQEIIADLRVIDRIEALLTRRAARLLIDADEVVLTLFENAKEAKQAGNFESCTSSIRLLMQHLGMVATPGVHTGPTAGLQFNVNFNRDNSIVAEARDILEDVEKSLGSPERVYGLPDGEGEVQGTEDA